MRKLNTEDGRGVILERSKLPPVSVREGDRREAMLRTVLEVGGDLSVGSLGSHVRT